MSSLLEELHSIKDLKERIAKSLSNRIVGQNEIIEDLLTAVISGGHVLMVGVPGLAKTLMITTLADLLGLDFKRVQFTPDLMPSDIIGTEIITENRESGEKSFKFIKGPLFTNLLLADEINRTPPKTQSALLQAMQEKEVTVGNETVKLSEPFFVLATQNPIEQEGTYPLPEAQLDRFMFSLKVDYPSYSEEVEIVKRTNSGKFSKVTNVITKEDILNIRKLLPEIPVTDNIIEYAVSLVRSSRPKEIDSPKFVKENVRWGAGPRAGQSLVEAAKISAVLNGSLSPEKRDVNRIAKQVLRHRILPSFKAEAEGMTPDMIVEELIKIANS
ncbi:MAG: AAA family ATPase [Candidatus Cloacimonadota bacterium]|nr:MAG: AAA family ATPase [Candidatus Cloacimonadota bacterium]PIE77720.1 MAG: AAA family ATPase [Candidatus Delongbacteria bacterium]